MKTLVLLAIVVTMSVSCKKDATEYKLGAQNDMYMEFLGSHFVKIRQSEVKSLKTKPFLRLHTPSMMSFPVLIKS